MMSHELASLLLANVCLGLPCLQPNWFVIVWVLYECAQRMHLGHFALQLGKGFEAVKEVSECAD